MTDPFANVDTQIVTKFSMVRAQTDRVLAAYRENIALPEVSIADRTKPYEPVVVGEDGQPMTFERRQQLMKGKPTMVDERGRVRQDLNYRDLFADEITPEPLGATGMKHKPPVRLVRPRELQLEGAPKEAYVSKCVFSAPVDCFESLVSEAYRCQQAVLGRHGRVTSVRCSEAAGRLVQLWRTGNLPETAPSVFFGVPRREADLQNEIRFYPDPLVSDEYAAIFLPPDAVAGIAGIPE